MRPPESGGRPKGESETPRCDKCGLPIPCRPVTEERHGQRYHFCSESCRDSFLAGEREATSVHQFKRRPFDVAGLDAQLPAGFPRNSFVLLSSVPGTAEESLHAELIWRTLQRGEPAVVVAFEEPPFAVVEYLLSMEWNVIPYLESGRLRFLDCFTERVTTYREDPDRLTEWNRYVYGVTADATRRVADFTSFSVLHDHLNSVVEAVDAYDAGLVLIDSLEELAIVQPANALRFVKDLRADFCKGRLVPVVGCATYVFEDVGFPQNTRYFADGIVELDVREPSGPVDGYGQPTPPAQVDRSLERTVRVLKMQGVTVDAERIPYDYECGVGMVLADTSE